LILDNISIRIPKGQYVAIVGKSGCGKSTLMRILLGFEQPENGAIYYDGKELSKLDVRSVRRNIGVVMQNGNIMSGDIYSNISASAPNLTMEKAWEAAEAAGIADDIRDMPMGMHTYLPEGGRGISGGQKQRLLIARAVAPNPKILFLDEATSALDNLTQKHVSEALSEFKSTRLVIAHRLSTIIQCDRIIMLEEGKIIEDGSYDELIKKDGKFADLVKRQQL
jgi:ABC-type bacteriocin/lantibiotic exporter with double-glycine peptidase domain